MWRQCPCGLCWFLVVTQRDQMCTDVSSLPPQLAAQVDLWMDIQAQRPQGATVTYPRSVVQFLSDFIKPSKIQGLTDVIMYVRDQTHPLSPVASV